MTDDSHPNASGRGRFKRFTVALTADDAAALMRYANEQRVTIGVAARTLMTAELDRVFGRERVTDRTDRREDVSSGDSGEGVCAAVPSV